MNFGAGRHKPIACGTASAIVWKGQSPQKRLVFAVRASLTARGGLHKQTEGVTMGQAADFRQEYVELLKQALCASLYDESAWRRVQGPLADSTKGKPVSEIVARIKHAIVGAIEKRGMLLVRRFAYNEGIRREGLDWPLFGYTMTGRTRLDVLEHCLTDVLDRNVPGDIVETGVWRGGSMILAQALLKVRGEDRTIWCADSFEGMPVPSGTIEGEDFSSVDYLAVSLEQVQSNFRRFGLLGDNIRFLKGWFCDTLPTAPIEQIALLRLDGDLYESTNDALVSLYPKLSPGGFVIVDDYHSWPGCKKAVDEYRAQHGITSPIVEIDAHAVYWKG